MAVALVPSPNAPPTSGAAPAVIPPVPLRLLSENARFWYLDRLEQYYGGHQDDGKRYDWHGNLRTYGGGTVMGLHEIDNAPGYYISLGERRPDTRKNLARMIVSCLTQMAIDGPAFAQINVEDDEQAEKALREWAKHMRLAQKTSEARNKGGTSGTACMSLGVVQGMFELDVHSSKHCQVLAWQNRAKFKPAMVLKAYSFERDVYEDGAMRTKTFWYVRYWDERVDITWEAIPKDIAELPNWAQLARPDFVGDHNFGFCPFYWTQNLLDSEEEDGEGDYEGLEDKFDAYNRLYSATTKGTTGNVDPTLVIHKEDDEETQVVKGTGAAIFSPEGAEYLEIKGEATRAAIELLKEMRSDLLEEAQVVYPREGDVKGLSQSAAAMRITYAKMIPKCDALRTQYGDLAINILTDVLRVARGYAAKPPLQVFEGSTLVREEQQSVIPPLDPGKSSLITLKWPEYFNPTSQDIKDTVSTAQAACGGKPIVSHLKAVEFAGRYFGIEDAEAELDEIDGDADKEAERSAEVLKTETKIVTDNAPDPYPNE